MEKELLSPIFIERRKIMNFFNEKRWLAFETGKFICAKCGAEMKFEDKWEEHLTCPKCGYKVDAEHYGFDSEEEYEALYQTLEERLANEKAKETEKTEN